VKREWFINEIGCQGPTLGICHRYRDTSMTQNRWVPIYRFTMVRVTLSKESSLSPEKNGSFNANVQRWSYDPEGQHRKQAEEKTGRETVPYYRLLSDAEWVPLICSFWSVLWQRTVRKARALILRRPWYTAENYVIRKIVVYLVFGSGDMCFEAKSIWGRFNKICYSRLWIKIL
jgi:hypothetical protein